MDKFFHQNQAKKDIDQATEMNHKSMKKNLPEERIFL